LLDELAASLPSAAESIRAVVRLIAALMAGGIIGFQREASGKAAGLRTHMLVCAGTALFVFATLDAGMQQDAVSRVIQGLATGIGFILLIVPGLYLMTIWSVIAPVVVVERTGVFDSFGRSRALVKGHGWQVFGVIVLVVVVVLLLVVTIITAILIDAVGDAGGSAISWALNVLTAPITALVAAVLYFALRVAHGEPARPEDAVQWMPPAAPGGTVL